LEEGTMNEDFMTKALSGSDMGQEGILQMSGHRMARLSWTVNPRGSTIPIHPH
jgi:hypothetical protein